MDDDVRLKRRLTAVLLADVVGYSRLMNADEEGTHLRLADHVKILIEPAVATHRGRLVRSMGDGMLVEFDSAFDAVRCGVEIQRGLAAQNASDIELPIQLRIGINTGDVIVDERDIYGNSINIAARLEGLARPGEVFVTRGVRDQLRGYPSLAFEDMGESRVKNIDRPIRVFRVEYDAQAQRQAASHGLAATLRGWYRTMLRRPRRAVLASAGIVTAALLTLTAPPFWRDGPPPPPRNSIVVLPFKNFSDGSQHGYMADAITDDLTTDLARVKGTFVISRETAFTFKGRSLDARQIGKDVGVRYLLEGSIRRDGTRIETNVQLIDAQSGGHIWADHFESDMADLFALQKAVTGRIAASLDIQLVKAEGERNMAQFAGNPDAVDLRLQAVAIYISATTPEHALAARRLLEQSVQLDPSLAESWSWLAEILMTQYLHKWGDVGKPQVNEAAAAVAKALAIDPDIAQAYYAEGLVRRAKGEHQAAFEAFSRAVELNPNLPRALAEKGNELTLLGRPAEAPPLVEQAIKLSPRDPSLGGFYWIIGRSYFFARDYRRASPWLRKSVALRPHDWYVWLYLVSAYALDRKQDEANNVLQEFNNHSQFKGYTIQRVNSSEKTNPDDNPVVVAARQKLREGLQIAGMPAQ